MPSALTDSIGEPLDSGILVNSIGSSRRIVNSLGQPITPVTLDEYIRDSKLALGSGYAARQSAFVSGHKQFDLRANGRHIRDWSRNGTYSVNRGLQNMNVPHLDGANDICTVPGAIFAWERTQAFTVSAWVNPDTLSGHDVIASNLDAPTANPGWQFNLNSGKLRALLANDIAGNNYLDVSSTPTISTSAWTHVAMTYDGTSLAAGVTFYINGVAVAKDAAAKDTLSASIISTSTLRLGATYGSGSLLDGYLSLPMIFNRALSANEVAILAGKDVEAMVALSGCVGAWTLEETSGDLTTASRAWDISSYANHGSWSGHSASMFETDATVPHKSVLNELGFSGRRNFAGYSEDFDNGYWVKNRATVTANAVACPYSPSGFADKLIGTSVSGTHFVTNGMLGAGRGNVAFEVIAKAAELPCIILTLAGGAVTPGRFFNLQAGTIGGSYNSSSKSAWAMQSLGDGWYRCILTDFGDNPTSPYIMAAQGDTSSPVSNYSWTGDDTSGVYIASVHVYDRSFPAVLGQDHSSNWVSKEYIRSTTLAIQTHQPRRLLTSTDAAGGSLQYRDSCPRDPVTAAMPCLTFDDIDSYIDCGAISVARSAFTMMGWCNFTASGTLCGRWSANQGAILTWNGTQVICYTNGSYAGCTLAFSAPHHVAFVYESATIKIYVDGVLQPNTTTSGTPETPVNPAGVNFQIGAYGTTNYVAAGQMWGVQYYSTAKTAAEIAAIYNGTDDKTSAVAIYPLAEKAGTNIVHDIVGGNHGTMSGFSSTCWDTTRSSGWDHNLRNGYSGAAYLDGTTGYFSFTGTGVNITKAGTYSVSMWARVNDTGGSLFQFGAAADDRNGITYNSIGLQAGYYNGVGYTGKTWTYATQGAIINQWRHIVFVNNAGSVSLYVDGEAATDTGVFGLSASNKRIGMGDNGPLYTGGYIRDVRIWNKALSPTEAAIVAAGGDIEDLLIRQWKLNGSLSGPNEDLVANGGAAALRIPAKSSTLDAVSGTLTTPPGYLQTNSCDINFTGGVATPETAGLESAYTMGDGRNYGAFDGATGYVKVTLPATVTYPFSYVCKSIATAFTTPRCMLSINDADQSAKYFVVEKSAADYLQLQRRNTTAVTYVPSLVTFTNWKSIAVIFVSDTAFSVYVDGFLLAALTGQTSVSLDSGFDTLLVGLNRISSADNWWTGNIRHAGYVNSALTPAQILAHHHFDADPTDYDIYLPLIHDVLDISGNGNDGTIVGGVTFPNNLRWVDDDTNHPIDERQFLAYEAVT